MRNLVIALWLASSTIGFGQQLLSDAPKPVKHRDRVEAVLLTTDAASRALDVYSTHQMLRRGYHELLLPKAVANHTGTMAAYSAGTVALDWFVTRHLENHGHRKLARIVTIVDIGQDLPWAVHNLFLSTP